MSLDQSFLRALHDLMEETRTSCLWSLRRDYTPQSPGEIETVLRAIEKRGDVATFQRARALRTWLSQLTNANSAAS